MFETPELTRLENDFSVAELLPRLNHKLVRQDNKLYLTDCPACGSDAWVLPTGMFCNSSACKFTAGGPVEFLAALRGKVIAEVLPEFHYTFRERTQFWNATDPDILLEALTHQLTSRRRLFEFFLRIPSKALQLGQVGLLAEHTESWRSHLGPHQATVFHVAPDAMNKIRRFLNTLDCHPNFPVDRPLILFPFQHIHHAISSFLAFCPKAEKTYLTNIMPSRYAFSGLLNSSPAAELTYLMGNPITALKSGASVKLFSGEEQTLGLFLNHDVPNYAYMPESVIYCVDETEAPGYAAAYQHTAHLTRFVEGAPPVQPDTAVSWFDYVVAKIKEELDTNDGVLSTATMTFAQGSNLTSTDRKLLIHNITTQGYLRAAESLTRQFATRVVYRYKSITIQDTPTGYLALRHDHNVRESITNFTFELDHNLIFEDGKDIFHAGKVTFQGSIYPVVVSSDDINSAPKLQQRVQTAVLRNQAQVPDNLPLIRDRSLYKYIAMLLRENASSLKSKPGMSQFGWHYSRKKYMAPCWQLELDGLVKGPFEYHPERPVLSYFDSREVVLDTAPPVAIPSGLADLARMILGGVFRDFCYMPIQGVPMRQSRYAQLAIETVFGQLGQSRPVNAAGPAPDGIHKFPAFGYDYTTLQLRQSTNFIFGLGDHGFILDGVEDVTEDELVLFGRWVHRAVLQLVEYLLTQGALELERERRILFVNELIAEGDKLLHEVFAITDWPSKPVPYEATEKLLDGITPADLGKFFAYDYTEQQVRIFYPRYNKSAEFAHALELELRSLTPHVEAHSDYLATDSPSIHNVLQHFYGTEIRIPELA